MDDHQIISRFLDGDPLVHQLICGWIRLSFIPHRMSLAHELDDLEQEILLDLTQTLRADGFRGQSSLRTYVRTCAHYKCIDRIRSARRRRWVEWSDLELTAPDPSPLDHLTRKQSRELALRVQEEMPASCRELLNMLMEGLRYREMSDRLGIAEGALRARVLRCRRRAKELRRQFSADVSSSREVSVNDQGEEV